MSGPSHMVGVRITAVELAALTEAQRIGETQSACLRRLLRQALGLGAAAALKPGRPPRLAGRPEPLKLAIINEDPAPGPSAPQAEAAKAEHDPGGGSAAADDPPSPPRAPDAVPAAAMASSPPVPRLVPPVTPEKVARWRRARQEAMQREALQREVAPCG